MLGMTMVSSLLVSYKRSNLIAGYVTFL